MKYISKYKLIVLAVFIIVFFVLLLGFFKPKNRVFFPVDELFFVELEMDDFNFGILDWEVDFEIKIKDLKSDKEFQYDFYLIDGPYIDFCISEKYAHLIWLKEYQDNGDAGWLINLEKNSIRHAQQFDSLEFKNFRVIKHFPDGD